MDHLDAEILVLEPLAAHGAFLRAVGPGRGFRIGRPEHDHVAILQTIYDGAIGFRLAHAQAMAPVMDRAPVPAFPAIRVVVDLGMADRVLEAVQRAQVIADIAPGMVRPMADRHHAGTVFPLGALDLAGDNADGLVPGNPLIARFAPVLGIAFAIGVEIDPFHGIEQPVR